MPAARMSVSTAMLDGMPLGPEADELKCDDIDDTVGTDQPLAFAGAAAGQGLAFSHSPSGFPSRSEYPH
jgi:hypothetical protein